MTKSLTRRKRRKRKRTPGIRLLRAQKGSRQGPRIAYDDPENPGTEKRVTIPKEWRATDDLMIEWIEMRATEIEKKRRDVARGIDRPAPITFEDAIEQWLVAYPPNTQRTYRDGVGRLQRWAADHKVHTLDKLTNRHLLTFRTSLASLDVANTTRNKWLRSTRTFLEWAMVGAYCPQLTEAYPKALKKFREAKSPPKPLQRGDVRKTFEAAARHDAGEASRFGPILPMIVVSTLLGTRRSESVQLDWTHFRADAVDESGRTVGAVVVPASISKTKTERTIFLDYTPGLHDYLIRLKLATGAKGTITGVTYHQAGRAQPRLRKVYGAARDFSWQRLRITSSTFLTSAPSIFGSASHSQSAARLGHSWKTAETFYAKSVAGISGDAKTLEDALGIADLVKSACDAVQAVVVDIDSSKSFASRSSG